MTQHGLLSANISRQFTQHIKSGILGQGGEQGQQSKRITEKFFQFMKKNNILHYFQSISCIHVSIHGCNCCQTGINVSKCVYLASMVVKLEHTVAGHNHDILQ